MTDKKLGIWESLKRIAGGPERSPAWLQGWHDSAHRLGNKNGYDAGSYEHAEYESGYQHWRSDSWAD